MLHSLGSLRGYKIIGKDGEIGKVKDALVEDQSWHVRYLVVDTGNWLHHHRVMLSTGDTPPPSGADKTITIGMTKEQLESAPHAKADEPFTRKHEADLFDHFRWVPYWTPLGTAQPAGGISPAVTVPEKGSSAVTEREAGDPHLRSVKKLEGHELQGADGYIGWIEHFLFDDETWQVDSLVVVTAQKPLRDKQIRVSIDDIQRADFREEKLYCDMTVDESERAEGFNLTGFLSERMK